jgi:phosphoribosylglycinamide formyltransferase-1
MSKRPPKLNIAVLASTNGTDLQAIIDELKVRKMPGVNLKVVVSNVKDCYALQRAHEQGFETEWVDPKGKTRTEFDRVMIEVLEGYDVDLIVLVGFMRILSSEFVQHYKHRIINVHPSLLPKYGGKGFLGETVHQAVLDNGDAVTGMTIHFVDEGCDTGPIIHQAEVEVTPDDHIHSLKDKVQALEKKWYPEVIRWIQYGKIVIG